MNKGRFRRLYFEPMIHGGFLNLLRSVLFTIRIKELKLSLLPHVGNTSVTDSDSFKNYGIICKYLANSPDFRHFRRIRTIIDVYDHVTYYQAKQYIEIISRRNHISLLNDNCELGQPMKYKFKGVNFSISTLNTRYSKVCSDIKYLFPNLEFNSVAEIGGGFGGLAYKFKNIPNYTLYDLPEVNELSKKILERSLHLKNISFMDGRDPQSNDFELVISNYAFSELSRNMQKTYLDRIILRAEHGYITWSPVSFFSLDGYSLAELIRILPKAQIMDERPLTGARNVIIYW